MGLNLYRLSNRIYFLPVFIPLFGWIPFIYLRYTTKQRQWAWWGLFYFSPFLLVFLMDFFPKQYADAIIGGYCALLWGMAIVHSCRIFKNELPSLEARQRAIYEEYREKKQAAIEKIKSSFENAASTNENQPLSSYDQETIDKFKKIAFEFGIPFDGTTQCINILEELYAGKLFADKFLSNELSPISNPPVILKKGEQAYYVSPVEVRQQRTKTDTLSIYAGTRIKIGSFPIYFGGRIPISHIEEVLETVGTGDFIITNKRIILSGTKVSYTIPIDKILATGPYDDALQILCEGQYGGRYYTISEPVKAGMLIGAIAQAEKK